MTKSLSNPTLEKIDKEIERSYNERFALRSYLGVSAIGEECLRRAWYNYRWVKLEQFNAESIKRFADGEEGETLQAKRLRMLNEITLLTHDENGKQFRFERHEGHLAGHCDGKLIGLSEDPENWHIWEHKQVNEEKFRKLLKLIETSKNPLKEWDFKYYVQATLYMKLSGIPRHFLTVSTPGGRKQFSLITELNDSYAEIYLQQSEEVIYNNIPPKRISIKPDCYLCRMCPFSEICHSKAEVNKSCRTCISSRASRKGNYWECEFHDQHRDFESQKNGCTDWHINPFINKE